MTLSSSSASFHRLLLSLFFLISSVHLCASSSTGLSLNSPVAVNGREFLLATLGDVDALLLLLYLEFALSRSNTGLEPLGCLYRGDCVVGLISSPAVKDGYRFSSGTVGGS